MSKKTATKSATRKKAAPKATNTTKATTPGVQMKKDAKGRFWLVPKDGGDERGPFATKKEALDAQAGKPAPEAKATKAAKKAKAPKEKKVSAIEAAAQVLASSNEPMNAKEMIEAMASKGLWTSPGARRRMRRFTVRSSARSRSRAKMPGL